ncbi:MAG: sulfatase [Planctomycetota bacterium]
MRRRDFCKTLGLAAAGAVAAPGAVAASLNSATPKPPNLLYVFADQLRLHALGFWRDPAFRDAIHTHADPVHTPNLDRLARQSRVLTQACSTHPLCSPHRAMLMSGMYPANNGVMHMNCRAGRNLGLRHDIACFTDVLGNAGYETAYIGKTHWERTEPLFDEHNRYVGTTDPPGGHYANDFDTYIPPGPGRHGNRYWFQNIGDRHKDPLSYASRPELVAGKPDGTPHRHRRFTPEHEADIAIEFLRNRAGQRDASRPFSLFWSPNPPHNPYSVVDRDCDRAVYERHYADMPTDHALYRPNIPAEARADAERCVRIYYALVTSIDQHLGRVLDTLDEIGETDNTLIVFTSDHGELMGSHGTRGKNVIYDESFLVPFIARFPGVLTPKADDLLLGTVDIMPTLLSLMGLGHQLPQTVQGRDYSAGLRSDDYTRVAKPSSALYLNGRDSKGIRTDRYTYLVRDDASVELYDNREDPYQLRSLSLGDVSAADGDMLRGELGQWLGQAGDAWHRQRTCPTLVDYSA